MQQLDTTKSGKIFKNPIAIVAIALFCCALWGSATPFIKTGYIYLLPEQGHVPSIILFAGTRFLLAGFLTILIYSIARRKILYPKRENLGRVATVSLFQTVIQYIFFYIGLANTTGVKGTIASGSSTFFALLVSALIFKQEKFTSKKIIACILGFAGIVVINLDGLTFDMNFFGDAFVVFSAISAGTSSVLIKKVSAYEDPVTVSGYQFMMGGAFMIVTGLIFGGKMQPTSYLGILVLIYLAFLSAVAYSLWGLLLKYNSVSKITIFNFSTPIFGTILSLIMLSGEAEVNFVNLSLTLVLVSLGIFLLNYQGKPKPLPAVATAKTNDGENDTAE